MVMVSQLGDILKPTGLYALKGWILWYVNRISIGSCMRKAKTIATDVRTQTGGLVKCGPSGALLDQHGAGFSNELLSAGGAAGEPPPQSGHKVSISPAPPSGFLAHRQPSVWL